MIGYKAFNSDLTCIDFQYEIGKTYEIDGMPICCNKGFHFCKDLKECFRYYDFGSRVCEVEALGSIDTRDEEKFCTNKIKILRELSFKEICNTIGIKAIIGENLIKSFELTKEFYRKKGVHLGGSWDHGLGARPFCWFVHGGSGIWNRTVGAQLSRDFERIEFFNWKNFDKVLFKCDNKKIYQVNELDGEDLEWFEYLKENLKF